MDNNVKYLEYFVATFIYFSFFPPDWCWSLDIKQTMYDFESVNKHFTSKSHPSWLASYH